MPSTLEITLFCVVLLVLLPSPALAFGAGDIPDFAYLNSKICLDLSQIYFRSRLTTDIYTLDKAFRHGDIESILQNVAKVAGAAGGGGGLLKFASSVLSGGGGKKFSKPDIKHVYFVGGKYYLE